MTQTLALLLDSYRELNAKRLFWVVLAVSALVVGLFAAIGLNAGSVSLFGWVTPLHTNWLSLISPATFYNYLFVTYGVGFWLSWLASILALVSTAGMFPDLMAGGSIDLYLSKPIARAWLFATKVAGGLLFVALQVTVFCLCSFVVLRLRGGTWQPGVFVAVPLVTLMFSYLFAICILLGVLTRSTIAALLITLVLWVGLALVQRAETLVLLAQTMTQQRAARLDRQIAATEDELNGMPESPATAPATRPMSHGGSSWFGGLFDGAAHSRTGLEATLANLRDERQSTNPGAFDTAHAVLAVIVAPLPKTAGTIEVLERQLINLTDLPPVSDPTESDAAVVGPPPEGPPPRGRGGRRRDEYADRQLDIQLRQRSAAWILGTSVAFEAVVLALAGWLFSRRDY